jgi:hypothetical protein
MGPTEMKCFFCESDARAVCQFCGRFVCKEHAKASVFHTGFGQKLKDNLWPSGSDTGISVDDAVWCGFCALRYERTY